MAIQGGDGLLRIRAGDYRILYTVNDDGLIVLVVTIGHRRDLAYEDPLTPLRITKVTDPWPLCFSRAERRGPRACSARPIGLVSSPSGSRQNSRSGHPASHPTAHNTRGGGPGLAALLLAHIRPVCSLVAPCDPGAATGTYATIHWDGTLVLVNHRSGWRTGEQPLLQSAMQERRNAMKIVDCCGDTHARRERGRRACISSRCADLQDGVAGTARQHRGRMHLERVDRPVNAAEMTLDLAANISSGHGCLARGARCTRQSNSWSNAYRDEMLEISRVSSSAVPQCGTRSQTEHRVSLRRASL